MTDVDRVAGFFVAAVWIVDTLALILVSVAGYDYLFSF